MNSTVDELRLAPSAESVGAARRHVRTRLLEAGHPDWAEAAELAVSEVVTNGVLHAHTALVLRLLIGPSEVLVEVEDGSDMLPSQRTQASEASTTGRGLSLLAAVTQSRGVRSTSTGKVVWFTVSSPQEVHEPDPLAAFADAWVLEGPPADQTGTEVQLLGMPPTLWMAAREHHQTLLRELVLFLAEHADALPQQPDLPQADTARSVVWAALFEELDRSRDRGTARRPVPDGHPSPLPEVPPSVDLTLSVPPELGHAFSAFQDALDIAEDLARHDRLLVRPGLPEIVAVRDWACEQVVAQLAGVPASPWPGTDQERFTVLTNDRRTGVQPEWDADLVTRSTRGVVAADDANRIIAVSPSFAAFTGWDPDELVGRRVVALIPPALREAHVAGFSRHLSTGEAHVLGVPVELPVLHHEGHKVVCTFLVERADSTGRPVYLAWIEPLDS